MVDINYFLIAPWREATNFVVNVHTLHPLYNEETILNIFFIYNLLSSFAGEGDKAYRFVEN